MFSGQLVRDAVVVVIDLDMVIDVDRGFFPFRIFIGGFGERFSSRAVEVFKEFFSGAVQFLELAEIKLLEFLPNRLI